MCGLAGIYNFKDKHKIDKGAFIRMLAQIKHRGPDEFGTYVNDTVGLGCARLSIIDLRTGKQPVHNEDKTKWIVFTGEIFNYKELKNEIIKNGHIFYTDSDTEVLIHLYEELGIDFIRKINGQFALAVWDDAKKMLILARDRVGIRPLYYTIDNGRIIFASEVKSIFADPKIKRRLNLKGLDQIITFWTTVGTTTIFEGISELPPGHCLLVKEGEVNSKRYWDFEFDVKGNDKKFDKGHYIDLLRGELIKSLKLQLQSDVPIGAYLSGGVDSSVIAALLNGLVKDTTQIKTFSVRFEDKDHDESGYQEILLKKYKFKNFQVNCTSKDIGMIFPKIIWHTEKPIFRTAPAPLYFLSRLARQEGVKVILSGEGADEAIWGYDTYRENKIRLFWSRFPESDRRPLLFKKIFPYLSHYSPQHFGIIKKFYHKNLMDLENPFYSHLPRWENNGAIKAYYSQGSRAFLEGYDPYQELKCILPSGYIRWEPLQKNQYLETLTLLPGYLLSSQGDRMLMANSVEGRYPFLDHNFLEFCSSIPSKYKVFGIRDKFILREAFKMELPEDIYKRSKFAYTSPDARSFFGDSTPGYIKDLFSKENIEQTGYFDHGALNNLINKITASGAQNLGYRDNMAMVIIVSTLLLHDLFIRDFRVHDEGLPLAADFDYRRGVYDGYPR
jgi:asparagine synthase (glutamine-hydrolysing)